MIWPKWRARLIPFKNLFDHIVAEDFNDIYDILIKIEEELGVNPQGAVGTLWSRLINTGLFDQAYNKIVSFQNRKISDINYYTYFYTYGYNVYHNITNKNTKLNGFSDEVTPVFMAINPSYTLLTTASWGWRKIGVGVLKKDYFTVTAYATSQSNLPNEKVSIQYFVWGLPCKKGGVS